MSKNRITKSVKPVITSKEEAEATLGEVAKLQIEINGYVQKINEAINAARIEHEAAIAAASAKLDVKVLHLGTWAKANPSEFGDKRSIEFLHGTIGYRKGNPSVTQLRGHTVDETIETLKIDAPEFIRTKEEIDKEAILAADAKGELEAGELADYGLQISQTEKFYVEPKLEAVTA